MPKARTAKQSLNDKVTALKRDGILDAAQDVFSERGYHRTTIKDIAARAGIADGTVYNYFDSKDALLSALFDRYQLGDTAELPPEARIARSFDPHTLELLRVLLSEMLVDEALRARYRERFLKPLDDLNARLGASGDPLAGRTAAATVLGLTLLRLLGDPVTESNWARVPELLKMLADPPSDTFQSRAEDHA